MLTPADIDGHQFSTTRIKEGYVQEEVDAFLDRVQEDYGFLSTQVSRLDEENRTLRRKTEYTTRDDITAPIPVVVSEKPSAIAEKMLAAAETAAEQHLAEARADADKIIREAGGEAARLVEEAVSAAERIKSEGLAEKYRRNDELDSKISAGQNRLAELITSGDKMRKALGEAVAAYDRESK